MTTSTTFSTNYIPTTSTYNYAWNTSTASVTLTPDAKLQVDGNVVIRGRDLEERLSTIEKILNIPERDIALEKKYPKLKKMYDEYINELSKAKMWESIKGEEK